jgi:hypothetical protein
MKKFEIGEQVIRITTMCAAEIGEFKTEVMPCFVVNYYAEGCDQYCRIKIGSDILSVYADSLYSLEDAKLELLNWLDRQTKHLL